MFDGQALVKFLGECGLTRRNTHVLAMFPPLKDENWKTDLAFLIDVLEYLNKLNVICQGQDLLVHELYTAVQAFKATVFIFKQIKETKFIYFILYKEYV